MGEMRACGDSGVQFRTTETKPNPNPNTNHNPNPTNPTYPTDPTKPYRLTVYVGTLARPHFTICRQYGTVIIRGIFSIAKNCSEATPANDKWYR